MRTTGFFRTHWCFLVGLLLGAIFWCAEAFLHSTSFQGDSFLTELAPASSHELWMRLFCVLLFVIFGLIVDLVIARLRKERDRSAGLVVDLTRSLAEVKRLSGLLPICAVCKKVRDDAGYWQQVESYIRDRSEVEFSHGYCPECAQAARRDFMAAREAGATPR